jgi:glycosyltransferase involved in cell wall biosynthesis
MKRLLDNLSDQTFKDFDLVVIDASKGNEVADIWSKTKYAFPVIYQKAVRKGLPSQRKQAVAASAAELLCFLDDDVLLESDFLQIGIDIMQRNSDIAGISGYITNTLSQTTWRTKLRGLITFIPNMRPGILYGNGMTKNLSDQPPFSGLRDVEFLCGGLTFYRVKVFQEIPISEDICRLYELGLGKAEDLYYSLQVAKKYRICLSGDLRAQHLHAPGSRVDPAKVGRGWMATQHLIFKSSHQSLYLKNQAWYWSSIFADTLFFLLVSFLTNKKVLRTQYLGRWHGMLYCLKYNPSQNSLGPIETLM